MTTYTNPTTDYVETHPHLVTYWDQHGRPVGYTSHRTDVDAENAATRQLGRETYTGAIIARASFYNLDPATTTYTYTNTDMEH